MDVVGATGVFLCRGTLHAAPFHVERGRTCGEGDWARCDGRFSSRGPGAVESGCFSRHHSPDRGQPARAFAPDPLLGKVGSWKAGPVAKTNPDHRSSEDGQTGNGRTDFRS